MTPSGTVTLSLEQWTVRAETHRRRIATFVDSHLHWRTHGLKHPVYDFLFSYYSFSSGQLLRWTPGINVHLESKSGEGLEWPDHYRQNDAYWYIAPECFPRRRIAYLEWAIRFLAATYQRPPVFHCFGMHEWAMLYRVKKDERHPELSLRVSDRKLEEAVEANPIRCSHYDAFRFFSDEARPLNRTQLVREDVTEQDQPGCVHANMDLYRIAYKVAPFLPSELVGDLFLLAREARELDMKASPYDLGAFDVEPIPIETREGRESYVVQQRKLFEKAQPFRATLLAAYTNLLHTVVSLQSEDAPLQPCTTADTAFDKLQAM